MSKREKNDFIRLCNDLKENYKKEYIKENEITYVRKHFESDSKISEDKDVLLKIKAEAEENDYNITLSLIFSMLAMFFAAIGVLIQFLPGKTDSGNHIIIIVILITILIILFLAFTLFYKLDSVKEWRKYVLIVVNQSIEKLDKQEKKKNKKRNK